ncbi:alpha/beta hydrolase [Nocardioides sp. SYSU DS0651]|uniref:alpha/beta hydrolase n=1 Tax=Nocardioides sp. SYSU DS0651 TaxID=3415955 RepID=UPI003F4AF7E4
MQIPRPVMRAVVRTVVKPVLSDRVAPRRQRAIIDGLTRLAILPKGTRVQPGELGGRPADRIATPASDPDRVLLYLHGGGYTVGSRTTHRAVTAHLAHAAGVVAHLLDYRLAPEHPYPAAVDDALAAYRALLDLGVPAPRIVVAGDSAGGGLTLALALRLRAEGLPLPRALALISPWPDLRLDGLADAVDDPLLSRGWLQRCARDYGGDDVTRPEVSPLLADLSGLPPVLVHGASDEILIDDVERLVDRARDAGVTVTYERLDGLWHVAHLYAGMMRESTEAVAAMGGWLRARLDERAD